MKNVLGLAVGQNYECVIDCAVTAHPAIRPYPSRNYDYIIPIRKGGVMECVFSVATIVECLPDEVYSLKGTISDDHYRQLVHYHERRMATYTYGDSAVPYRFYILKPFANIQQPYVRKYIQMSIGLDLNEIPLLA